MSRFTNAANRHQSGSTAEFNEEDIQLLSDFFLMLDQWERETQTTPSFESTGLKTVQGKSTDSGLELFDVKKSGERDAGHCEE